ncbi:helix-turn-helix domain-containing protein [Enterococcus sp. DIV0212c]|uniref:helix-turn-helix domain-containing protein n=1 Tax=Enterococcus sp. DIV0212c TaxID=2230867 RepID=UPI0035C84E77
MKKNEANKFELLKKLLYSKQGLSIQEIITASHESKSTIYRYIQQLNEDLTLLFTETPIQIEQKNTTFYIVLSDLLNIAYILDKVRLSYIYISPEILIFAAAAGKNHTSLESLAQSINLSPSYTYKSLNIINKQLHYFRVSIGFGDFSRKSNVYGAEADIRFFLFYMYWNTNKGIVWPFNASPDYFKELPLPINTTLAPSQHMRLRYHQNITYWRILYLQEKISITEEFLTYLFILDTENPTKFTIDFSNTLTIEELKNEQVYFGFLSRFFIPDIDTKESKQKIAQLFIDSGLPLTKSCIDLLELIQTEYDLVINPEEYLFYYYNLMIALLYVHYIEIDYQSISENEDRLSFLDDDNQDFSRVEKEINHLVSQFFITDPFLKEMDAKGLVTYMTNLLYCIIDSTRSIVPLYIFCQYSKNFYMGDKIKKYLLTTFGSRAIHFTTDIQQANLVISDSYEGDISNRDFFYFDAPYESTTWEAVSLFVSTRIQTCYF